MGKKHKKNRKNSKTNKKIEIIRWGTASVLVPLLIGGITPYIIYKSTKAKEYVYIDSTKLDDFKADQYFPLEKGNYWIYERRIEYLNEKGIKVELQDEVKCKVIDKLTSNDLKLYVLKGNPFSIPDIEKNFNDLKYGYIVAGNKLIGVGEYELNSIITAFKNDTPLEYDVVSGLQVEFEFPLYDKQKFGDTDQLLMHDIKNTYYVEKLFTYEEKKGDTFVDASTFLIRNTYNSGDSLISFVPYTGITGYSYEHRGTLNNISFKLKEKKILND